MVGDNRKGKQVVCMNFVLDSDSTSIFYTVYIYVYVHPLIHCNNIDNVFLLFIHGAMDHVHVPIY